MLAQIVGILLIIASILLIVFVLLQNPRSEGGGLVVSGDYSNVKQLVGIANLPSMLEKITKILAGGCALLTLLFTKLLQDYLI